MAITVVSDVSGGTGLRSLRRGIAVLLGALLVLAGIIAAGLPLLYGLFYVSYLVDQEEPPGLQTDDLQVLGISIGIVVVGLAIGLRLIRGRRRLGLFLRKFGFSESTRTVTNALTTAVGRSVRLVTLDDAMVAPLGVSRSRRRIAWWVWALAVGGIAWGLYWAFGGGYGDASKAALEIDDPGDALGAGIGLAIWLLVVFVLVALAGGVALFGGGAYLAARRAERLATRAIDSERAIDSTARSIAAGSRRILGARLVVVRVATAFWQKAVSGLAAVADVVVIDVSHPTDALVWEVTKMKSLFGNRWVLVGARDRVTTLASPATALAGTPQGLLARLLDGEDIIAYGPDPADQRRFARALRRRLHQVRRR